MVVRFPAYVFATFGVRGDGGYGERRQRRGWNRMEPKEQKNREKIIIIIYFFKIIFN